MTREDCPCNLPAWSTPGDTYTHHDPWCPKRGEKVWIGPPPEKVAT